MNLKINLNPRCILYTLHVLVLLSPAFISAATIDAGSSYNEVLRKLGAPDGEIAVGNKQILTYGDAKITLRDKTVIKVSPELEDLLAKRTEKQKEIKAKRDANLVNFRGEWMTPGKRKKILRAEGEKRAHNKAAQSGSGWLTDFRAASDLAKAQNKKLLLNFTGSDWCGWCIKLENEVFSQPEFKKFAQENYILVKLDFPRKKRISASLKKQNQILAKKYKVKGYPSIVVLTPSGKFHKRGGYVKGGPNAFLRSIL